VGSEIPPQLKNMTDIIEKTKTTTNIDVTEPSQYKVIYINDEVTTFEFVISSLIEVFNFNEETSYAIAKKVHEDGFGVVAIMPYEIAEQKVLEATVLARVYGYPLVIKVEEEK
jgi:ATP-dependent Clp protease adaptor protein ClpS